MAEHSREAEAAVREASTEAETPAEVDPHPDRTREIKTPGFSRMRTDWSAHDSGQIQQLRTVVDGRILKLFPEAFVLMNNIYDLVRQPQTDGDGVIVTDKYGFPVWARNPTGGYIEDFTILTDREKEDFLFRITTNLFEWRQTAADLWGEAMFAKAQWEEAMAIGYDSSTKKTVEDRTQAGRLHSTDERYFSIFLSLLSRKADAIVNSCELLGQRLKDTLQ